MKYPVSKHHQEEFKKLQEKKDAAHQAFLDALTYVKPFEEIKKLYQELKSAEAELNTAQTLLELNVVVLN